MFLDMLCKPTLGCEGEAAVATGENRLDLDFGGDLMLGFDVSVKIIFSVGFIITHLTTETMLLSRAFFDMIRMVEKRNKLHTIQTLLCLMRPFVVSIVFGC